MTSSLKVVIYICLFTRSGFFCLWKKLPISRFRFLINLALALALLPSLEPSVFLLCFQQSVFSLEMTLLLKVQLLTELWWLLLLLLDFLEAIDLLLWQLLFLDDPFEDRLFSDIAYLCCSSSAYFNHLCIFLLKVKISSSTTCHFQLDLLLPAVYCIHRLMTSIAWSGNWSAASLLLLLPCSWLNITSLQQHYTFMPIWNMFSPFFPSTRKFFTPVLLMLAFLIFGLCRDLPVDSVWHHDCLPSLICFPWIVHTAAHHLVGSVLSFSWCHWCYSVMILHHHLSQL